MNARKQTHLRQYTIPFLALTEEHLAELANVSTSRMAQRHLLARGSAAPEGTRRPGQEQRRRARSRIASVPLEALQEVPLRLELSRPALLFHCTTSPRSGIREGRERTGLGEMDCQSPPPASEKDRRPRAMEEKLQEPKLPSWADKSPTPHALSIVVKAKDGQLTCASKWAD